MPAAPPEAHQAGAPPTAALQLRATVPAGWSRTCIMIVIYVIHIYDTYHEGLRVGTLPLLIVGAIEAAPLSAAAERSREQSEQSLPTPVHATQVALGGLAGQLR